MSQSITATLEAPPPARRSLTLPAPVLTAAIVLGLAHVSLLWDHFHILWRKPHYELFPLVFLIFPAMFLILLGPALFMFFRALGGAG